jgi:hypothetical protein
MLRRARTSTAPWTAQHLLGELLLTASDFRHPEDIARPSTSADTGFAVAGLVVYAPVIQGALRRGAIVLIGNLAMASLIMASGAGARSPHHERCLPRRAHVVAEDRDVRIYSIKARYMVGAHRYPYEVTYACLLRSGTTMKLTEPNHHWPASDTFVTLNGTMVAYAYSDVGVDTGSTEIVAANVAAHRILLTVPNATGFIDACVIAFRELKDLVVTDHGSVAWILRMGHGCQTQTFQVYDRSSSSETTLLDEGMGIEPESLRVSNRSVSWEDGGRRRYALLP